LERPRVVAGVLKLDSRGVWWRFPRLKGKIVRTEKGLRLMTALIEKIKTIEPGNLPALVDVPRWEALLKKHFWSEYQHALRDIRVLENLFSFLAGYIDRAHPGRIWVWVPGIEGVPEKHAWTIVRLHRILARVDLLRESRGTPAGSIIAPSRLARAIKLRRAGWSIPRIVDRLEPRAATEDRETLIKRYQRAVPSKSASVNQRAVPVKPPMIVDPASRQRQDLALLLRQMAEGISGQAS